MKHVVMAMFAANLVASPALAQSAPSDADIRKAIVAVFVGLDCQMTGDSLSELESRFGGALAVQLGVPKAQLRDPNDPLYDRSDDVIEDMMREGLIVVDQDPPAVRFENCQTR